jgi:hypothetical protein
MKNHYKVSSILLVILFLFPLHSSGQCDPDKLLDKCASNLGTYNYIKSFVAYANPRKKSDSENTYVFSKGSTYKLIACDEDGARGRMIISLYDRNRSLIACTFNDKTGKYYTELLYPCSSTGVYYIKATFENTKNGCGMFILGFTKD